MRIYLDEAGTFQVPVRRDFLLSLVAALVIPGTAEAGVFYDFTRLRDSWGITTAEIKGRKLDEARIAQVISLLGSHDAVLEFVAIDMVWHRENDLTEFKQHQAQKVVESLTPQHTPTITSEMNELSELLGKMSNQLFVQAYLTIELIHRVFQTSTLYYSQRIPEELGRFEWMVDRKDRTVTTMERLWTTLIVPTGQTRAFKEPFITLKEGTYTYFDRFRLSTEAIDQAKEINWLDENITFPIDPSEPRRYVDMKKVLQESFRFADSESEL